MTDVAITHTPDGGEMQIVNGTVTLSDGLYNAAYYSLFGGNADDGGTSADDSKQWWGNSLATEDAQKLRSRFQNALNSSPIVPSNLVMFQDAANADLEWMLDSLADSVSASASMPGLNTVAVTVAIEVDDQDFVFTFTRKGSGAPQ